MINLVTNKIKNVYKQHEQNLLIIDIKNFENKIINKFCFY